MSEFTVEVKLSHTHFDCCRLETLARLIFQTLCEFCECCDFLSSCEFKTKIGCLEKMLCLSIILALRTTLQKEKSRHQMSDQPGVVVLTAATAHRTSVDVRHEVDRIAAVVPYLCYGDD